MLTKINILAPVMEGADRAEANQGAVEIVNGFVDSISGTPSVKIRPGLEALLDTETGVRVDLYWWEAKRYLIIASGEKIWVKRSLFESPVEISPTAGADIFPQNTRVFFSADEHGVTMSAGQHMLWWGGDVTVVAARITGSGVPYPVSSLAYLKGYTIASIQNTQQFAYALYGAEDARTSPPPWSPLYISASASPDNIMCLAAGWEELFILGRESSESHYVSGNAVTPLPALSGSVSEVGAINSKTLQKLGNAWMFLTPQKQVVRIEGRTPRVLSKAIDQELHRVSYFDAAEAFTLFERFYVLTFPSGGKTFVYDLDNGLWYRWETWDDTVIKYRAFKGISSVHAKSWGHQLVGGHDGKVYKLSYDIGSDDRDLIRLRIRSAHLDHDTLARKFGSQLQMRLRCGERVEEPEVVGEVVYGTNWTALATKLAATPLDMVAATDGFIYIVTAFKIWKADSTLTTFTEMTLDGVVKTGFNGICESYGGRIVTADAMSAWVKPAGSDTFTIRPLLDVPAPGTGPTSPETSNVTGSPDSTNLYVHGSYGGSGRLSLYNIVTEEKLGGDYRVSGGLSAWAKEQGVIADNGNVIIVGGGTELHSIWRQKPDLTQGLVFDAGVGWASGNHQGRIWKDETSGRIWVVGQKKTEGKTFYQYSDDHGETWTDPVIPTGAVNSRPLDAVNIVDGKAFVLITNDIYRATKNFTADLGAAEFEFDGSTAHSICRLSGTRMLVATNGTTSNLYLLAGYDTHIPSELITNRKLLIRWRDNGRQEWSNYREIALGEIGETDMVRRIQGLGQYKTRQYEFVCSSNGPLTIAGIEAKVVANDN
jgi:hypothetical protein